MKTLRLPILLALTLAVSLAVACATAGPREVASYDSDGNPVQTKRLDNSMEIDYWQHWVRTAYFRPGFIHYPEPQGQSDIIIKFGRPDWVRSFTSLAGEPVKEWLYPDLGTMYQFIGGTEVYEGPITDIERVLLRRGYPDIAIVQRGDPEMAVTVFTYTGLNDVRLDDYHFVNGRLQQFKEGN